MVVLGVRLTVLICCMASISAAAQVVIPDSLHAKGKSVNNRREGVWRFYAPSTKQLQIEGSYRSGMPEGKWFWYAAERVFFEQSYRKGLAQGWGKWYAGGKLVGEQWFNKGVADSAFAYYNAAGHYALRGMTAQNHPRGMWQVFFPDGNLAAEWYWFRQGAYHGAARWFYPNGKHFAEGYFLTSLAEGKWEFRASDESWHITGHFKDNLPHGTWTVSEKNGQTYKLSFKDGQLEGQQVRYHAEGRVVEKIIYSAGRLVQLEENGKLLVDAGTGERIFRNAQGQPLAKGTYQNGFLEGAVQYFGEVGEILTQNYRQGQPQGAFELHNKQGQLLVRGFYNQGQTDSICSFFYPSGTLQAQGRVTNGLQHGDWYFFYPNGTLQSQGTYCNGIAEGLWNYYDATGRKTAEGMLHQGCPQGEWLFYTEGLLTTKGNFEDGLRQGIWTDYYPNGIIKAQGSYARDREQGEWRYFHTNGSLRQTEQWQNGKLLAISDFTTPDGRKMPRGNFKNGNGSRLIYHEKRRFLGKWQVSVSGQYKDGLPEGRWRYYDRKGRLQKELIFVQGKLKSDD